MTTYYVLQSAKPGGNGSFLRPWRTLAEYVPEYMRGRMQPRFYRKRHRRMAGK
jgi:hypothetical protein